GGHVGVVGLVPIVEDRLGVVGIAARQARHIGAGALVAEAVVGGDVVAHHRIPLVAHEQHEAAGVVMAVVVLVGVVHAGEVDVVGLAVVVAVADAVHLVVLEQDVVGKHRPHARVVGGAVVGVVGLLGHVVL